MKTTVKELLFSIVTLYWQGPNFSSRRLQMVNVDKILQIMKKILRVYIENQMFFINILTKAFLKLQYKFSFQILHCIETAVFNTVDPDMNFRNSY